MARKLPAIIEAVRSGRVNLTGVRLLSSHLTPENHEALLAKAAGLSKDEIMELVAALAPRPPPPPMIRKMPEPRTLPLGSNERVRKAASSAGRSHCGGYLQAATRDFTRIS